MAGGLSGSVLQPETEAATELPAPAPMLSRSAENLREIVTLMGQLLSSVSASSAFSGDLKFIDWVIISTLFYDDTLSRLNISAMTGMSYHRVKRTMATLESRGYITRQHGSYRVSDTGISAKRTVDNLVGDLLGPAGDAEAMLHVLRRLVISHPKEPMI